MLESGPARHCVYPVFCQPTRHRSQCISCACHLISYSYWLHVAVAGICWIAVHNDLLKRHCELLHNDGYGSSHEKLQGSHHRKATVSVKNLWKGPCSPINKHQQCVCLSCYQPRKVCWVYSQNGESTSCLSVGWECLSCLVKWSGPWRIEEKDWQKSKKTIKSQLRVIVLFMCLLAQYILHQIKKKIKTDFILTRHSIHASWNCQNEAQIFIIITVLCLSAVTRRMLQTWLEGAAARTQTHACRYMCALAHT